MFTNVTGLHKERPVSVIFHACLMRLSLNGQAVLGCSSYDILNALAWQILAFCQIGNHRCFC